MPADTRPGRPLAWQVRHSLWLWTMLPFGITSWAGFLYIGLQAHKRSWLWSALGYGAVLVVAIVLMGIAPEEANGETDPDTWQANVSVAVLLVMWVAGIVHGFVANRGWLAWREARVHSPVDRPVAPPPPWGP